MKIVNLGISIIKLKEDEFNNKTDLYYEFKERIVSTNTGYWVNREGPIPYDKYPFDMMFKITRAHLLSQMKKLDLNADPDWILLLKQNYSEYRDKLEVID